MLAGARTLAAQNTLDPNIVEATILGPEQQTQLDRFIAEHAGNLDNDDPIRRRPSRIALLSPFSGDEISVDFRLNYAERLMPVLERIVADGDTKIAIAGLRIAGALATDESVRLLIDAAGDDDRAMRYTAAWGIAETFEQIDRHSPAIDERLLEELISTLEVRLRLEQNPYVFDVVGRSPLGQASRLDRPQWREYAERAQAVQAEQTAARVTALDTGLDDYWMIIAIARTLESQRLLITDYDASRDVAKSGARLAGQCIAYAAARARAGTITEKDRLEIRDLVRRAESLITFAHSALEPGGRPVQTNAAQNLAIDGDPTRFDDEAFAEEVESLLIGPDGALCQPPFDFSPAELARKDG